MRPAGYGSPTGRERRGNSGRPHFPSIRGAVGGESRGRAPTFRSVEWLTEAASPAVRAGRCAELAVLVDLSHGCDGAPGEVR
jgi:hypothetical protein